jgi:helix-turn-helix, Psq domain
VWKSLEVPVLTWNRILINFRKGTKLNNLSIVLENCKTLNIFRLLLAVDECRAGKLSQRVVAEMYGVKRSTIAYHVKKTEAKIGGGLAPLLTEALSRKLRPTLF